MKMIKHILLLSLLIAVTFSKFHKYSNKNHKSHKKNTHKDPFSLSVTPGPNLLAMSNNKNRLHEQAGFVEPKMVSKIPFSLNGDLNTGEVVEPNTTPFGRYGRTYYDGRNNLNVIHVECSSLSSVGDCVKSSGCGWCGQNNSCIPGTASGPMAACLKNYYFKGAVPLFNPLNAGTINIMARTADGHNAITNVGTPDMSLSRLDAFNPYN